MVLARTRPTASARELDPLGYPSRARQWGTQMRKIRRVRLIDLIEAVQDTARSDEEVVAVLTHLMKKSVKAVRPLPVAA